MIDRHKIMIIALLLTGLVCCRQESDQLKDNAAESSQGQQDAVGRSYNFEMIPSEMSGLNFKNSIVHDLTTKSNVFDHDYFYNGSGVGIEDIDNDGLPDIIFTANQGPNRLFLNKGNLVFEDITEKANINPGKNWSSGVTFADVNNDGWIDIYIAQGGPYDREKRKNLLLINQKDNTFSEKAEEYGLDDMGISTHSAFFDFDKDGDLDCVIMNENEYYGVYPSMFYKILSDKKKLWENSSHLYRNDGGKFTDITEKAGLLRPSFGLGLCISDINDDNWLDIYLVNDYYLPDVMYINNKNGTFSDQIKTYTRQISFSGMGIDIADIDGDNRRDIFVLDMAPTNHVQANTLMASMDAPQFDLLSNTYQYQPQYMFNSLQLNLGNNQYHNVAQLAGLSRSDWSWAALIFDTDHDEKEDLYITNGYRRYSSDFDIRQRVSDAKRRYNGQVPLSVKEEIYNSLPVEKLANMLFANQGDLIFENRTSVSGLGAPSFSNGAAYSDLDQDGDLDLVVNNMDDEAFLFRNNTIENDLGNYLKIKTIGKLSEDFARVTLHYDGKKKTKESKRVRGYLSAVDKTLHFGLGKVDTVDTVRVLWPSGKVQELHAVASNTTLVFKEEDASTDTEKHPPVEPSMFRRSRGIVDFTHRENEFDDFKKEILLPYKQSTLGPCIGKGDINGDGLQDLYLGGAHRQEGELFVQTRSGFRKIPVPAFTEDAHFEDMEALFFDIDGDLDQDLYVVSGGSEFPQRSPLLKDRIYLNDGNGSFSRMEPSEVDQYTLNGKTVSPIDFDRDGDMDLIIGNRIKPQGYPVHEPSLLYENIDGTLRNVTSEVAPDLEDFGMVNKVISTDLNNDGWQDFIAVGEWTHIGLFLNEQGKFTDIAAKNGLDSEKGWWFSIVETDVNGDGNKDYLVGNIGHNIKYRASRESPLRIYADDFDANGTHDVVMSHEYNGEYVPIKGKEHATKQMPFLSIHKPTYQEYADASIEELYGDKIHTAYQREANQLRSILLLNIGQGNFQKIELPNRAQAMPILDGSSMDLNGDGYEDLILVGNIYNVEAETPRLDNPYGLVLISDQTNGYTVLGPDKTGIYIRGNAKTVELIHHSGLNKVYALVGINDGPAENFELNIGE